MGKVIIRYHRPEDKKADHPPVKILKDIGQLQDSITEWLGQYQRRRRSNA